MKLVKTKADFGATIYEWFINDWLSYDECGGKVQSKFYKFIEIACLWIGGEVYAVTEDGQIIGFVYIEVEKRRYHTFILPEYRKISNCTKLPHCVFNLFFEDMGVDKCFTLCDKKTAHYFAKTGQMQSEKVFEGGLELFSLTKEKYQCQFLQR